MVAPVIVAGARILATHAVRALATHGAKAIASRVMGSDAGQRLAPLVGHGVHLASLVEARGPAMASALADLAPFASAIRKAPAPAPQAEIRAERPDLTPEHTLPVPGMRR